MPEPYDTLNRRWQAACRALLSCEVGQLADYAPWLSIYTEPNTFEKSCVSGKEVAFSITSYAPEAKRISYDEIDFGRKAVPLSINQIKDMDSIIGAMREQAVYAGNIVLGNSVQVQKSTSISDCHFTLNSARFTDSKYVCNSTMGRFCEDCYGCHTLAESSWCVKCSQCHKNTRNFETWMCKNCADCYFSFGLDNCMDCIFSFNVKNYRHTIGNLKLEKQKYLSLKKKLLSEIAGELVSRKKLPSLIEIIKASAREKAKFPMPENQPGFGKPDIGPIERQFGNASRLIFGKPLAGGMRAYSSWLLKNTRRIDEAKSVASGRKLYIVHYANFDKLPRDRLIGEAEAYAYGKIVALSAADAESISLANAHKKIGRLAYCFPEIFTGTNTNIIDCALSFYSSNCLHTSPAVYSKYCGYNFWPRNSSYCFGTDSVWGSEFCIKCYNSSKITRCFECDSCHDSADALFSHNCDNLRDSMFCFNVKNLAHAIGNAALPIEQYKDVKASLVSQMADELEKKHDLKWDIFSIGAPRRK